MDHLAILTDIVIGAIKLWTALLKLLSDPERIENTLRHSDATREAERRREDAELEALLNAHSILKRERGKLLDLHLAEPPLINRETFQERSVAIDKKLQAIEASKAELAER